MGSGGVEREKKPHAATVNAQTTPNPTPMPPRDVITHDNLQ